MINIRVSNEQGEVLKELQLGEGTHNIGRTPDNTIELRDMKVSRDHAKLIVRDGVCNIVDTNSTTGVFVNEEKILTETELRTGDVIHIGDMVLDISFEEFSGTKLEPNQIGCLRLISGGVSNLHVLDKAETIMGRIPECDIQVMDQMASRQHSKVVLQGGSYFLEDCNSSNGTFLNDIQITKQPLQNGDVIKICNHAYKFQIKDKAEVQMQVVSSQKPSPPPAPAPQPMISTTRPTRATPPTMHGYEVSENKKGGSFTKVAAILVIIGLAGVGGYNYKDQIMQFVESKTSGTNNTGENQNKNENVNENNNNQNTNQNENNNNTQVAADLAKEIATAEQLLQTQKQQLQSLLTSLDEHNRQLDDINDQISSSGSDNSSPDQEEVQQLKREIQQIKEEGQQAVNERNMWKSKAKKVYMQYKRLASGAKPPKKQPEQPKQPEKQPEQPREEVKQPEQPKQPEKQPEQPREEVKQPVQQPQQPSGNVSLTAAEINEIKKINAIKNKPVDYKKIVTANRCGECHKQEKQVWQKTPHYKTFNDMSKKPRAKGIFEKLGLKGSIKRSGRCSKCHFTQQDTGRKPKAVMGVSCESCHGAGKDWLLIHNDRTKPIGPRREHAMSLGMNNPVDIYLIAQNCYGCHSVPDEELVNIGGHKAGSAFELVSWSQGMVRHNFVRADNKSNAKSSPERLRVMFVTGLMLDLEYALRGLLKVTKPGTYYDTMMKKVDKTYKILKAADEKSGGIKEIQELLALFAKLNMKNRAHLEAGANLVTLKARAFTKNHDGSKLSSLDAFIPKNYK